jgi:hypothetical protein
VGHCVAKKAQALSWVTKVSVPINIIIITFHESGGFAASD